jgi:uncharacterized protein YndB with AHSA1/START domain
MARIEASIEIAAAPMIVFRFCHDLARWPEWNARVVGTEMITSGPVRRGSLIRIDAGRSGQYRFTWEAEYVSYQMPSGSTLKVLDAAPSSPFKSGMETWQLSHVPGGTRFTLIWEYEPRGFISRVTDALGGRSATQRAIRRSLNNLKALIETG